jgi:hypothetical protein
MPAEKNFFDGRPPETQKASRPITGVLPGPRITYDDNRVSADELVSRHGRPAPHA